MSTLAESAGVLAERLGLDLRHKPKSIADAPTVGPCRCLDARGRPDPRLVAPEAERCSRCGRWLDSAIGGVYDDADRDAWERLWIDVEVLRSGLLDEASDDGVLDQDDYVAWLETRLAACERSLDRTCGRRR